MALITKTLLAHNLHKFTIELQKAFEDGWRVSPSAVARRSISNRFTVSLQKEVEEKVNTENVETAKETEAPTATETQPETQTTTEKPEEAPAKPLTKAQQAKLAKEEAAKLAAEAETKENEGEAE
jgi:hypothetical protein